MGKILFLNLCICSTFNLSARVHDFETARLKSTGGAGLGSLLANESVFLNPAPLSFFNVATFTGQYDKHKLSPRHSNRAIHPNNFDGQSTNKGFFLVESSSKYKGAVAYLDQVEGKDNLTQWASAFAIPMNDTTGFGANYQFSKETNMGQNSNNSFNYHKVNLGLLRMLDPSFGVGLVWNDIGKSKAKKTGVGVGFQYVAKDIITLMTDLTSDYREDISKNMAHKVGAQFKLIGDLYIRGGLFSDKRLKEKGTGYGIGWVGPKLVMELGLKNTKPLTDPSSTLLSAENYKETSFSLSYIFDKE